MPAPMVPSLGRLVLPLVLLLSFTSNLVFSTHVTCRWQPGKGSPAQFSYVQYCEAGIIVAVNNNKTTSAEYRCPPNNVFKLGAKIAEWGKIGPQLLEWYSPCGDYGRNDIKQCIASHWALCLGSLDNCLYMASQDDCQWPNNILSDDLPELLTIWHSRD